MTKLKIAAALFGLSVAALAAAPASAAPVASNSVALKAAVAGDVVTVASKKSKKVYRGGYYYNGYNGAAPWWGGPDTVGSLGYDGRYYAYNRFSGQHYYSCMLDLGYGRVRPCDAGSR
jgi:hypothetical protein